MTPIPAAPARIRRRATALASLAIAGAVLAGCVAAPEEEPDAAASATPEASEEATPTPEPTRPAIDELVLSARGIGDIELGEPVPPLEPEVSPVVWDPQRCQLPGYPDEGRWLPVDEDPAQPSFWVITQDTADAASPVEQIGVRGEAVATAAGTHVGSTRAELEAQEPDAVRAAPGDLTDLYVATGDTGSIAFEVANAVDGYWEAAQVDTVVLIWVADATIEPVARSGSGGAGYCFT